MKTRILFILLAASSLFACSEEGSEGGDDMHPFFHKTYVRFRNHGVGSIDHFRE